MRHTSIGKGKNNPLRIFQLPALQQEADSRVESQKPLTNNLILTPVPQGTRRPQTPFCQAWLYFLAVQMHRQSPSLTALTPPIRIFRHLILTA